MKPLDAVHERPGMYIGPTDDGALSDVFDLRIWRDGKEHFMPFHMGNPEAPLAVVGAPTCRMESGGAEPRSPPSS